MLLLARYDTVLQTHPLPTKMATAGLLSTSTDLALQSTAGVPPLEQDHHRTARPFQFSYFARHCSLGTGAHWQNSYFAQHWARDWRALALTQACVSASARQSRAPVLVPVRASPVPSVVVACCARESCCKILILTAPNVTFVL